VFYITASIYAFSTIFYGRFASGEQESWAASKDVDVELTVYGTEQRDHKR